MCAVAVAGTLTRLRRLPVIACLAGGVAALLLYLNLAFENARSLYHLLPTPASLRSLWDLAGTGFNEAAQYAPPVPELHGMVLLAAAGIGITALLTDLIAVRLESAALAGLPLLLLFTEPFTLSVSRSAFGTTVAFCLGAVGYLTMLSSEGRDRIREWEQPNPDPLNAPDTRALAAAGRRVGLASVVLALAVPLFVPGLHATRLFGAGQPGIGGNGGGAGGVGFPDPNTQLSKELHASQPTTVLIYKSSDTTPQYLQIYALDNLTGSGWQLFSQPESLVPVSPGLPAPPGLSGTQWATPGDHDHHDRLSRSARTRCTALPVPYPATAVAAPGTLRADKNSLMLFDNGVRLAGLSYSVNSLDESPPVQVLDSARPPSADIAAHYLEVPVVVRPAAEPGRDRGQGGRGEDGLPGRGRPAGLAGGRHLQVHPDRADGHGRGQPDHLPREHQEGVLPAVLVRHGRAGPAARHPVPRRLRLHRGDARVRRHLAGHHPRRARLAGAVLPGRRLAPVRADAAGRDRTGHGDRPGVHARAGQRLLVVPDADLAEHRADQLGRRPQPCRGATGAAPGPLARRRRRRRPRRRCRRHR